MYHSSWLLMQFLLLHSQPMSPGCQFLVAWLGVEVKDANTMVCVVLAGCHSLPLELTTALLASGTNASSFLIFFGGEQLTSYGWECCTKTNITILPSLLLTCHYSQVDSLTLHPQVERRQFVHRYLLQYIWVNYNDLTVTSLESWLVREIISKWP